MRENNLDRDAAAALMRVPPATLGNWLKGRKYNDAPAMAVDLLCQKLRAELPPWLDGGAP